MKFNGRMLSRVICALVVVGLLGSTALAASGRFSISTGQAGLWMFGEEKIGVGETFTASNGQEVPGVITYTDEAGGMTNYLPVSKIAELFDATISWDAEKNSVMIGGEPSGVIVIPGGSDDEPELATVPEYGVTVGPFTEVDPATVKMGPGRYHVSLNDARIQSDTGIIQEFYCTPGNTVVISVVNHGDIPQVMNVWRFVTVSGVGEREAFRSIQIPPGGELTRAFYLDENADDLRSTLHFSVDGGENMGKGITDISITAEQAQP